MIIDRLVGNHHSCVMIIDIVENCG